MAGHDRSVGLQGSPLLKASRLALTDVRTEEAGIGVADVLECVEHDDWEAALLLEDLGDRRDGAYRRGHLAGGNRFPAAIRRRTIARSRSRSDRPRAPFRGVDL